MKKSVKQVTVEKVNENSSLPVSDILSVEEPLEIRIVYGPLLNRIQKNLSVTMRTPGNDEELAVGFMFTEGIISSKEVISKVYHDSGDGNIIVVEFNPEFNPVLGKIDRNFYTTSSCGVCGKGSIDAVRTVSPYAGAKSSSIKLTTEFIYKLPDKLRAAQDDFSNTGAIHASGLFSADGELLLLREDVGRHNALDKLIGAALMKTMLPLREHILLLSGRASFELIQKAAMAGIQVVVAIGAPSSLAFELSVENNMTLIGFLRGDRFNIYNSANRILIPETHEDKN